MNSTPKTEQISNEAKISSIWWNTVLSTEHYLGVRSDEGPIPGLAPTKKGHLNATWLRLQSQFWKPTSPNLAKQICGASPTFGQAGCPLGLDSTINCCLNATDLGPRKLAWPFHHANSWLTDHSRSTKIMKMIWLTRRRLCLHRHWSPTTQQSTCHKTWIQRYTVF